MSSTDRGFPGAARIGLALLIVTASAIALWLQERSTEPASAARAPAPLSTTVPTPASSLDISLPMLSAGARPAEAAVASPLSGAPAQTDAAAPDPNQLPSLAEQNSTTVEIGVPMDPDYPPSTVSANPDQVTYLGPPMDADDPYGIRQPAATEIIAIGEDLPAD